MKSILGLLLTLFTVFTATSQIPSVPDPPCPICGHRMPQDAYSISDPNYAYKYHYPSCPYYPKSNSGTVQQSTSRPSAPAAPTFDQQMTQMVTGMIMQSMVNAIFSSNAEQTEKEKWEAQQAELARIAEAARLQKIRDSIAAVKHAELMGLYKPLEGTLSTGNDLTFKTLDGEMEALRSDASTMFDQGGSIEMALGNYAQGTNFFGSMTDNEINVLFEPDNDPMVVDLHEAKAVIQDSAAYGNYVSSLKENDPKMPAKESLSKEECAKLINKINWDQQNQNKYLATIDKTIVALDEWKEMNSEAMQNAFLEGVGFLTSKYVDLKNAKRAPAENVKSTMQKILKQDPKNDAAQKVISFLDQNYLKKEWQENVISSLDKTQDAVKYFEASKDALQNAITGMSATDKQYLELLQSPKLAPYLNDKSFTDGCKFVFEEIVDMAVNSEKVTKAFESVFATKVPYVAIAQFAVNQTYNATQWYISLQQVLELNKVHGKELETAQYLQNRIFSDQLKLDRQCK